MELRPVLPVTVMVSRTVVPSVPERSTVDCPVPMMTVLPFPVMRKLTPVPASNRDSASRTVKLPVTALVRTLPADGVASVT
ncbi:hypothetical protein D3C87_677450 [compost metagenome]